MARFSEQCQGVVAIDGGVVRRSFDRASGKQALHMVSAWGCEQRLVLAQIATDAKSNEITAVPRLLDTRARARGHAIAATINPLSMWVGPPRRRLHWLRGTRWWTRNAGESWACGRCHPPPWEVAAGLVLVVWQET